MRSLGRLLFFGWIAWACFVLTHYYVQLLRAIWSFRVPSSRHVLGAALPVVLLGIGVVLVRRIRLTTGVSSATRRTPTDARRVAAVGLGGAAAFTVPWLLVAPRLAAALSPIALPGLPWIGEAAGRLIIAFTGASLVAAATVSAGAMLLRVLNCRFTSRAEHALFAAVTGVPLISYGSLLLALLGIYRRVSVALLIGAALAAAAVGVPRALTVPQHALDRQIGWTRRAGPWVALIVVALAYGLIAALAPEKEYDALSYHLYLPRLWLDAGHPVDLVSEYVSLSPLTWELMFSAAMTLGGVVGAKLLHFVCLPLLALVVYHTAQRFLPGVSPIAAAAFVITTPTVLWESSTAYIDVALALHVSAAGYALARYAEGGDRSWRTVAALQLGVAAATKHLGVVLTLIALALYAIWYMANRGSIRVAFRNALLIGFIAAVVPSPWYVRSWVASGNPVFPEMFGVFGASPPERWDAVTEHNLGGFKARFGMGRSPAALAALPWNATVHGALFGGTLGPVFLVLIPGLVCARRWRSAVPWLAAAVTAYLAIWASPISSYQLRFLVPIVPALALLAAAALSSLSIRAAESMRHGAGILAGAVLILCVLNLPPFTRFHETDRKGWTGWLTHVLRDAPLRVVIGRESERDYLAREVPSFEAWQWINTHAPASACILTTAGGDQLYAQRARIPHDATIARPAVWVGPQELDGATVALRRLGITHVLFDRSELARLAAASRVLASEAFQQACTFEYSDSRFLLCRIDYARLPSPNTSRAY